MIPSSYARTTAHLSLGFKVAITQFSVKAPTVQNIK
jgi:hypothetical protein